MSSAPGSEAHATPEAIMTAVQAALTEHDLSMTRAARAIGVTAGTLKRHLAGAYVRSDSLARYRRWLKAPTAAPEEARARLDTLLTPKRPDPDQALRARQLCEVEAPQAPWRVVDLFSGCGGLSLGFELQGDRRGARFETVLALDLEEPMIRAFNDNHPSPRPGAPAGRRLDLTELLNEAEVLAFYLAHLAHRTGEAELTESLSALRPAGLGDLIAALQDLDARFEARMADIRATDPWREGLAQVPGPALSQTSVLGFHTRLKLPRTSRRTSAAPSHLWGQCPGAPALAGDSARFAKQAEADPACAAQVSAQRALFEQDWATALAQLDARAQGSGTGQLASSARKIRQFLDFAEGPAMAQAREAWLDWRAAREALRRWYFERPEVEAALRALYTEPRRCHVLLGGPPCQGFSRIGRGKLRSLREQQVHVQQDADAGDARNLLMLQYVMVVAALAPDAFLFENVRHFKAAVQTPEGRFEATEVLAEAINDISHEGLSYTVASEILDASKHLVPQTRERFFMVGLRQTVADAVAQKAGCLTATELPRWALSLAIQPAVTLGAALDGLPAPEPIGGRQGDRGGLAPEVALKAPPPAGETPQARYQQWVRQAQPGGEPTTCVDAHCARPPRRDDGDLFALFGPGKRWMDYRADDSATVRDLARLLAWLQTHADGLRLPVEAGRLAELAQAVDGSLPLRLLLESIEPMPGEDQHHLANPTYLRKREGAHGDWLARLDPNRPSKTMVSHMAKDTYAYVHPTQARTLSVREAARVQTFPDWFHFGSLGLVDGFRVVGNAVPPLLSAQLAERIAQVLHLAHG